MRCTEEEIERAVARGAWGGRLPGSWEAVDAEVYAVLAYLRRMALQQAADDEPRRCLVISDCKPALHQIESAWRQGVPQGFRERDRGAMLEAICKYRAMLEVGRSQRPGSLLQAKATAIRQLMGE